MADARIVRYCAATNATWKANLDLIRKAFLLDETSRRGGGIYHWKNIEAAKLGYGLEFQKWIQLQVPTWVQYFGTPIVIDNTTKQVIDEAAWPAGVECPLWVISEQTIPGQNSACTFGKKEAANWGGRIID